MPNPMTDAELAVVRARHEAATPGPWRIKDYSTIKDDTGATSDASDVAYVNDEKEEWAVPGTWIDNAAFIANARTDVPRILDTIDALKSELDKRDRLLAAYRARHLCEFSDDDLIDAIDELDEFIHVNDPESRGENVIPQIMAGLAIARGEKEQKS